MSNLFECGVYLLKDINTYSILDKVYIVGFDTTDLDAKANTYKDIEYNKHSSILDRISIKTWIIGKHTIQEDSRYSDTDHDD